MKKELFKKLFNIFIYILSAGLILYFCFSPDGLIEFIKNSKGISIGWLLSALGFHLLNLAIDSLLMHEFILNTSDKKIKYRQSFNIAMTGQFFNSVTPAASGGQPMQLILMHSYGISAGEGMAGLLQKFIVWQFSTTFFSVIVLIAKFDFFINSLSTLLKTVAIIGFLSQAWLLAFLLLISFSKNLTFRIVHFFIRLGGKLKIIKNPENTISKSDKLLEDFHEGNKKLNSNKKFLLKIYSISAVHLFVLYMVPYCVYRSFGLEGANLFDIICVQTFVNVTSSLVPSPGGSGAAELCFAGFFGNIFSAETLQSAILIWRTITYYSTILLSAPFAGFAKEKTKENSNNVNS